MEGVLPSPLCRIRLLLVVVFELSASLVHFLDYNFLLMSHFFGWFLDTVQYPSSLLHSWAVDSGEHFPLHSPLCQWPCKLPGHTFRAGCGCPQSAAGASFWRIFFFFPLQHFKFPAIKSPTLFFWGGSKRTGNAMPVSIFVIV